MTDRARPKGTAHGGQGETASNTAAAPATPDQDVCAAALEQAPQALVVSAMDGAALRMNRRARVLLNLADAQAVATWPGRLPPPAAESGSGWLDLPLGDGGSAPFWIWTRAMPIPGREGGGPGLVLHALWPCRLSTDRDTAAGNDPAAFDEMMAAQARHALLGEMGGALAHQMSQPLNIIRLTAERAAMEAEAEAAALPAHSAAMGGNGAESPVNEGARYARLADQAEALFETVSLLQGAPQVLSPADLEAIDLGALISRAAHLARGPLRAGGLKPDVIVPRDPLPAWGEPILVLQVLFAVLTVMADSLNGDTGVTGTAAHGAVQGLMIRLAPGSEEAAARRLVVDIMAADTAHEDHALTPVPPDLTLSRRLVLAALALASIGGHLLVLVDDQGALRGARLDLAGPPPPQTPPTKSRRRGPAQGDDRPRVLLVENDSVAAAEIAQYLRDEAILVDVAPDAAAALRALDIDPHDVLVCSLGSPEGGALPVMRAAEAAHPDMVLILVSGLDLDSDAAHAELLEMADAVLRKPLGLAQMRNTILAALKG